MENKRTVEILLVDDMPANLMALEAVLESLGQNLVRANSGEEALRHLIQRDFAVILLDVMMPGMNGFETAAMIRERGRTRQTPIIFMTAAERTETEIFRGYSLGAIDYLMKPFVPEALRSKVSVLVDLHRKTAEVLQLNAEISRHAEEIVRLTRKMELENEKHERIVEELRRSESGLKTMNISLKALAADRMSALEEGGRQPARADEDAGEKN